MSGFNAGDNRKKGRKSHQYGGSQDDWGWNSYCGIQDNWRVGHDGADLRTRSFDNRGAAGGASCVGGGITGSSSSFTAPSKTGTAWIDKALAGSQRDSGNNLNYFNDGEFERKTREKMRVKNKAVTERMMKSMGISPEDISNDEELASLDAKQRMIVMDVVFGKLNVFFTGPAGTGKSKVLNAITRLCELCRNRKVRKQANLFFLSFKMFTDTCLRAPEVYGGGYNWHRRVCYWWHHNSLLCWNWTRPGPHR